ncbi:hypothetical protein LCGC14_2460510, partial [marine sediment metagenome]
KYFLKMCKEIADWETSIQLSSGGYRGGVISESNPPGIFNTSQVLLGLIWAFNILKNQKYLDAAIKAGNFIVANQDNDGAWRKYCYINCPTTFNVRTAWALLELSKTTNDEKYKKAAIKNLDWALTQMNELHWFNNNDTVDINNPLLHLISYTIRGFLESGVILNNEKYIQTAYKTSLRLLNYYEKFGWLPARFNYKWVGKANYRCLTGEAQLSICWLKLYKLTRDEKILRNAVDLNNSLKSKQIISKKWTDIDGAIKGSDPIWGAYSSYKFPNWASKFLCDALILEEQLKQDIIGLNLRRYKKIDLVNLNTFLIKVSKSILNKFSKLSYIGKKYYCPCCSKSFRKFLDYGLSPSPIRKNARCPNCLCLERHRLIKLYLSNETNFFTDELNVLHIAPTKILYKIFSTTENLNYIAGNVYPTKEMEKIDITKIIYENNYFDVAICSHVLEYIKDEKKALAEFYRVLKPGGKLYIFSHIDKNLEKTYEDMSISSPIEREKAYGYKVYFRTYGLDFG